MLREFSAIGLSQYTGQVAATQLIADLIQEGNLRGGLFTKDGHPYLEVIRDMGPFQLIMRGQRKGPGYVNVEIAVPALKEKRAYALLEPEVFTGGNGSLYLEGTEMETLETVTLCLTDISRFYNDPDSFTKSPLLASCYGLSVEGKVLLGIYRSEEDKQYIREEEQERRRTLQAAHEGSEGALETLRQEDEFNDQEILDRLKNEDALSIYDGFLYPADQDENAFAVLGDITNVEKLLNPFSEEWVYYLELNILGQMYRVLINPCDLTGEPKVGRRFMGKVRFYGRLDPARLILEDNHNFF